MAAADVVALLPEERDVGELLARLAASPAHPRPDLAGGSNVGGGSGGQLGRFVEVGADFLKASLARRYAGAAEARAVELPAERLRQRLGIYPPGRLGFLVRGADGAVWGCSLTPRLELLRSRFNAPAPGDDPWQLYLRAFDLSFDLARREGIFLDCNPNNFGLVDPGSTPGTPPDAAVARLHYLDDDLIQSPPATFVTQALLRLREYPDAGLGPRRRFLAGFARRLAVLPPAELRRWRVASDLDSPLLWPPEPELREILEELHHHLLGLGP